LDLIEEAEKFNALFKMFGLNARAYSRPLRILWKEREPEGMPNVTFMVHEAKFETVEEWQADAHRRLAEAQASMTS